ncbi:MAG: tRNA dihydrouridine synthase DusB [Rhizobiaceae bacterium]|nr:tRNA dihydrouridine synthase DusB [Rhizobiaceae bacterium]MCV0406430.1 tRNA dihydrouridine synthase DusB [Rhizobiaceae bacterium]
MNECSVLIEPLVLGGVRIRNRLFAAPMSGISDDPFRRRAFDHGAGLVVTEMVASGELARDRRDTALRVKRSGISPHMVQLAGRNPHWMAEAARIAEGEGADLIDINMGCPAKKVTGGLSGSALMREPELALSLIDAVIDAVGVPVTVKMRLGWDETAFVAPVLARRAEQAGVAMVTIHGRTRCQFYKGKADWQAIRRVKEVVSIPVVANGDVRDTADALEIIDASGADAVMIGRAGQGAPWAAGEIARELGSKSGSPPPASGEAMADYIVAHHQDMLAFYGVESGLRQARKHLGWYFDRMGGRVDTGLRHRAMTSLDPNTVHATIREIARQASDATEFRTAA